MAFRGILTLSLKHMGQVPVRDQTIIHFNKKISNPVCHFVQRCEYAPEPGGVYGNEPGLPRGACAIIIGAVVRVCRFDLATLWHLKVLALLIQH